MQSRRIFALAACSLLLTACGPGDSGGSDAGPDSDTNVADTGPAPDVQQDLAVLSVQPPRGPAAGGTQVAISGRGFAEGASVQIGGNPATDVTVNSANSLTATTPAADTSGSVDVTVELEGGDADTLADGFEYTGEVQKLQVGWCKLQHPPTAETAKGTPSDPIYGRVFVEGCTNGDAQCEDVVAELGYGPTDGDPSADADAFRWVSATYNADFTKNDNDEYQAALNPGEEGTFAYAYRFSVDGGSSWTYCDTDDSSNGFQADKMGELTVTGQQSMDKPVDWCNVQHPPNVEVEPGTQTPAIFGRVRSGDCTPGEGRCDGITAQLGWADDGTDPTASPGDFNWTDASYNQDVTGDNDEYQAAVTPSSEGTYDYAYRFSGDGGDSWTYCDTNGTDDGYSTDQAGELVVKKPDPGVTVKNCNLQHPPSIRVEKDTETPTVYGRARVDGCTDGGQECTKLSAELGWGPRGTDVTADPSQFTWTSASYNGDHSGARDEHEATLKPAMTGQFAYTYRFSGDGGQSWTYCDLDGTQNGVQTDQMGELTVVPKGSVKVGWCKLQHPPTMMVTAGQMTPTVYGRVYVAGCTHQMNNGSNDPSVECKSVKGQVGWGPNTADPAANPGMFTWKDATYNAGHTSNNNDEHQATFTAPSSAGAYRYVYRFSGDGGISWTYCDTDGNSTSGSKGFTAGKSGTLNVKP